MKRSLPEGELHVKQVGIWIRVSTEDQARGESPEHHERRARAYAESKGWTVREVYHLDAVSGKSVIEHAEAKRMLGQAPATSPASSSRSSPGWLGTRGSS